VTTTARRADQAGTPARNRTALFSAFAGLTALAILLQGLWAGLFVPLGKGGQYQDAWVGVHAHGGEAATLLALVTTAIAFFTLRARRELWIGSAVLTVLLGLELYIGGMVSEEGSRGAAAVHIPLALAIMAIAVWLPLRARQAVRR
jgi:heme A synthase